MLKDTRMTSFLIRHQMANEKGVAREKIWAVVLELYYIYIFLVENMTYIWEAWICEHLPQVSCHDQKNQHGSHQANVLDTETTQISQRLL